MVSLSEVMLIEPPPKVPPPASTAFSRSIFPDGATPIAWSVMLPPTAPLAVDVLALMPLLVPPISVMLPEATTVVPDIRPAVMPMFPAPAVLVVPSAVMAFEIVTSPSELTRIEPALAPSTATGLALDCTTKPPLPRVRMMMPPGPDVPPLAVSLPVLPTVNLWARIS